MSYTRFLMLVFFTISETTATIPDVNSLRHLIVISRHGARTPTTSSYNGDPNTDFLNIGKGQLTEKGAQLMFEYGKTLKRRYGKFLLNDYRTVLARSSYRTRCLQSGEAMLSAIYPRTNYTKHPAGITTGNKVQPYQAIPIYTMPAEYDWVLNSPALDTLSVIDYQFLNSLLSEEFVTKLIQDVSVATVSSNITPDDLLSICDALKCEKFDGLPLPPWYGALFPRLSMINDVVFREWSTNFTFSIPFARNLVQTVVNDLANTTTSSGTSIPITTHYYFTHDTVLAPFLGLLGAPLDKAPTFGATVLIEKHVNEGGLLTAIKFFYLSSPDATPVAITLPGCVTSTRGCTIDNLSDINQSLPPS